jgi:hypothetical protein
VTAGGLPQPAGSLHLTHGRSAPDACSVLWDGAGGDESVYGTSAPARFWVAVEQNGPWGRTPALQSSFPAALGAELLDRLARAGGRLSLIRRPGNHAGPRTGSRRLYVAWSGPDAFVLTARLDQPEDLLHLDLAALGRGDADGTVASLPGLVPSAPVMLVCTNGRRDVCCAVRGRPVAVVGHETLPGRVWECSHTGGHRFSPTGVLLPWGRALARLTEATVADVVVSADAGSLPLGLLGPRHDRGGSALPIPVQVAESSVRALTEETDLEALRGRVTAPLEVTVTHTDGRRWSVALSVVQGQVRRNSCGEPPEVARTWSAAVTPV